jgi:hypothetical protein
VFAIILGLRRRAPERRFLGHALDVGGYGSALAAAQRWDRGQVVETNWRQRISLNGANDLVIVPNSILARPD